jgi:hypothetical protein
MCLQEAHDHLLQAKGVLERRIALLQDPERKSTAETTPSNNNNNSNASGQKSIEDEIKEIKEVWTELQEKVLSGCACATW